MSSIAPDIAEKDRAWRAADRVRAAARGLAGGAEHFLEIEARQLPLWLPVALGAGIALWFLLPDTHAWQAAMLALGATAAAGATWGGRAGRCLIGIGLAGALGVGVTWLRAENVAAPRIERAGVARVEGRIAAVEQLAARAVTRVIVEQGDGLRVRLTMAQGPAVAIGDRISVRARLMPPATAAIPGAYDFARTAWFQRIGATGRALDPPDITPAPAGSGFMDWMGRMRARLTAHVKHRVGGDEGGVAASLVTGDQGAVSGGVADAMRASGLAHLLSISGLHVAAVVGGAIWLLRRTLGLSMLLATRWSIPMIAAAVGALAGIAYTLLAGANVPTVRACIAAIIVLIGFAMGREALSLRLLATAAFLILLARPEALVGPSFQLSFAAVTAIVALYETDWAKRHFSRRDEDMPRRMARAIAALLITGLAVEIVLAPVALFHFNRFGLYGALANIVAIPLTTFVIMPLEALALLLDPLGLSAPVYAVLKAAIAGLIGLAQLVAALPGATARLPTMPVYGFALMVTGALWILLWRSRARLFGLPVFVAGMLIAALHSPPDLLISGDGRHVARIEADGSAGMVRERAGEFIQAVMAEAAGVGATHPVAPAHGAQCGRDACALAVGGAEDRVLRALITRSPHLIDRPAFEPACAAADIVVSERHLPWWCRPRWFKADRAMLSRTGGLALYAGTRRVRSVAEDQGAHPWAIGR